MLAQQNRIISNEEPVGVQVQEGHRPSGSWALIVAELGIIQFLNEYEFDNPMAHGNDVAGLSDGKSRHSQHPLPPLILKLVMG